jgi:hypothetical protein
LDNVSVKKLLNRALYARGVEKLVCQGNQWENVESYGTQCVFGTVGESISGALITDDPLKQWEWNEFIKVLSPVDGESKVGGNTAEESLTNVVVNNVNVPKFTWTVGSWEPTSYHFGYGGGKACGIKIAAQGTKTGSPAINKTIYLTFGGQTIGTITSTDAAAWSFEAELFYQYQVGAGAGTFYYKTTMFDGNTVTRGAGALSGGSAVNVYENVPIQIIATTAAGATVISSVLNYARN